MEQNFQTSFIPKKPMIEQQVVAKRPTGVLLLISMFIFFVMLAVSGGAYFYKGQLTKEIDQMKVDLNKAKNRFEPSQITKLKLLDIRLDASNEVLSKHIAISPIFKLLQEVTLKTIRYTNFSYSFVDGPGSNVAIKMSGQGIGYRSIALQADILSKNKNIIDPVFSGLSLDEKGNVLFSLDFSVDPSFVNYKQVMKTGGSELNTIEPPVDDSISIGSEN